MYTIEKDISWEMGHRLTHHEGKCFNLHGHSYRAVITLSAEKLDKNGMVVDFYHFKKVKDYIDKYWDHALMLNMEDPIVAVINTRKMFNVLKRNLKLCLVNEDPTAENIARCLADVTRSLLDQEMGDHASVTSVTVYETATSSATYVKEGFL